jgi:hypothetical protein
MTLKKISNFDTTAEAGAVERQIRQRKEGESLYAAEFDHARSSPRLKVNPVF